MSNIPIKCIKCGAPIEIDPYKEFAKCLYCGTTNIIDNEKLSSRSNKVLDKFREYLPKLKEKKVYIPLLVFSIIFPVAVYKANYIDDFLVKECQQRDARRPGLNDFIRKKNYRKCLKSIKGEYLVKLKEKNQEIENACSFENQKRYKKLLLKPAFNPEEYPIGPEINPIDRKSNYDARGMYNVIKDSALRSFKPYYTQSLPWAEKKRNEFFSKKECKKFLRNKYIQYIF